MDKSEARQHALGYAAGREDVSSVPTARAANAPDGIGFLQFADAYASAWDEYNSGERFMMTNCRAAYEAWQDSAGVSIFREVRDTTESMRARRAARAS